MKLIYLLTLGTALSFASLTSVEMMAQSREARKMTKEEVAEKYSAEEQASVISAREHFLLDRSINDYRSSSWSRDIYRIVEDVHAENSGFFLPEESGQEFVNLFSLLLNLLNHNQIEAYRFDSDALTVEEKGKITLPEIFDVHSIPFTIRLDNTISFSRYDLPSSEVESYYIKEKWFFDQKTGKYDVRPVAICPVLHHRETYEFFDVPSLKSPLFWVYFDDIAAYLHKTVTPGGVSTLSRAGTDLSLFDVLRGRFYAGDIYQIGVRNIMKYAKSEQDLMAERIRLETELQEIVARFDQIR